jgi:hypothetical protein
MQLTEEQSRILDFVRSAGGGRPVRHVLLHAYAGAGKSFILSEIARLLPGPGLYLAFNQAIVQDIRRKLPPHFRAMTTHQLALESLPRDIAKRVRASLDQDRGRVALPLILDKVGGFPQKDALAIAGIAMRTLSNFCGSGDPRMGPQHLPVLPNRWKKEDMVQHAHRIWDAMLDFRIPITHDFYFKAWTLMGQSLPYFHRLVDEAQDTNPALLGSLFHQPQGVTWWAGDPYQSIYSWRGAVDALRHIGKQDQTHSDYLTRSFRFGDAPADLASRLLSVLGESRPVLGTGRTEITYAPLESRNPQPFLRGLHPARGFSTVAWVSFSNVTLLEVALQCIEHGLSFHIVGQGRDEKSLILAAMKLKSGKFDPKGPLSAYRQWSELEEEAASVPDGDAAKLLKLYRHPGFGSILDALNRGENRESDARVILTTAHRAKGREWDCVVIDPDLDASPEPTAAQIRKKRRFFVENDTLRFDNREDIHLRYVAFTRGRKHLHVGCPNLYHWWARAS